MAGNLGIFDNLRVLPMARTRRVDTELVTQEQVVAVQTKDAESLRCAQALLLPAVLGATLEKASLQLGVGRASVVTLQGRRREFCAKPGAERSSWGGRRRASLTPEEERVFFGALARLNSARGPIGCLAIACRVCPRGKRGTAVRLNRFRDEICRFRFAKN